MTDKPIIFSGPMVCALLDRRKTQTRRVLKDQPGDLDKVEQFDHNGEWYVTASDGTNMSAIDAPYSPGDRLWVKETWRPREGYSNWDLLVRYAADGADRHIEDGEYGENDWNFPKAAAHGNVSPLFMPRWASRLTLIVTDVRVERVQEISEADAVAEGIDVDGDARAWGVYARDLFRDLWDSLNAKRGYGWDANPWVVAATFTVHESNIDRMGEAA